MKLEVKHFLVQHGVDVCFLTDRHRRSDDIFWMENYVCHRIHRVTVRVGTVIAVCGSIEHYAVTSNV